MTKINLLYQRIPSFYFYCLHSFDKNTTWLGIMRKGFLNKEKCYKGDFHRPEAGKMVDGDDNDYKNQIEVERDLTNIEMFLNTTLIEIREDLKTAYILLDEYQYDEKTCVLDYLRQVELELN